MGHDGEIPLELATAFPTQVVRDAILQSPWIEVLVVAHGAADNNCVAVDWMASAMRYLRSR